MKLNINYQKIKKWIVPSVILLINIISVLSLLTAYNAPLCRYVVSGEEVEITMLSALTSGNVVVFCILVAYTVLFAISLLLFLPAIGSFMSGSDKFSGKTRASVYYNQCLALIFSITGVVIYFIDAKTGVENEISSLFPVKLEAVLTVLHAIAVALLPEKNANSKKRSVIPDVLSCIFVLTFAGIAAVSCFMDIAEINFSAMGFSNTITINGKNLLLNTVDYSEHLQLIGFILFAALTVLSVMTVVSVVGIIARSRSAKSLAIFTVGLSFLIVFALGLFGKYYQIAIKMNVDSFVSLYEQLGYGSLPNEYTVTVKSSIFYLIFVDLAIALALIISKVFTRMDRSIETKEKMVVDRMVADAGSAASESGAVGTVDTKTPETDTGISGPEPETEIPETEVAGTAIAEEPHISGAGNSVEPAVKGTSVTDDDFDNCPSFSELDCLIPAFAKEQNEKKAMAAKVTLNALSDHVVKYAAESVNHLSYKKEDIAVFLAGLGMSRLTILQGLSGTGKTSLPKIFTEAVCGKCEIVEVESSWKDKNELLGYYNEFSKIYSPKKFTRALYSAALCSDTVFFIVLDEMNLSRIEYYFSDFLSLMENDEDKREIRLLDHKIYNTVGGQRQSYSALKGDNTLRIPKNVWFIGTANRDESTFEISDKVYDRANTINFNKRAQKAVYSGTQIPPLFVSKTDLVALINDAIKNFEFDIERYGKLFDVEKLLEPYNITFGNRVLRQMEVFVKVYCSCFEDKYARIDEAMEKIMLSKLVSKLEFKNIRDKDTLVRSFEKLRLYECSAFINTVGGNSFYD